MVNSIIALDSEDGPLGHFFAICCQMVSDVINKVGSGNWSFVEMPTRLLNEVNLELKVSKFSGQKFVFSSFTHGSEDAIFANGTKVVYSPCNPNHLSNSMVFCFACSSGKTLGVNLINQGTLGFIGYDRDVAIWSTYMNMFAECATEAIHAFYSGNNIAQALAAKREKYNKEIDNTYKTNFTVAALLMDNRDALISHGDSTLSIDSFYIN